MREGSGMVEFHKRFPQRYHDVGIAEQHAVTFAAGLACEGLKPVVAIYSTFLQRGYDQLIHDVAIQNLPVVFALDRAGLVGADGATHAGAYDIAYLRCIPNMSLLAPADENECRKALDHRVSPQTTRWRCATRAAPASASRCSATLDELPWGKGEVRRRRRAHRDPGLRHAAVPGAGGGRAARRHGGQHALRQAAGCRAGARAGAHARGHRHGRRRLRHGRRRQRGAGGLHAAGLAMPVLALGLPDEFIEHGDPAKLLALQRPGRRRHRAPSIAARFGATAGAGACQS